MVALVGAGTAAGQAQGPAPTAPDVKTTPPNCNAADGRLVVQTLISHANVGDKEISKLILPVADI